jgi:hypothetical protein
MVEKVIPGLEYEIPADLDVSSDVMAVLKEQLEPMEVVLNRLSNSAKKRALSRPTATTVHGKHPAWARYLPSEVTFAEIKAGDPSVVDGQESPVEEVVLGQDTASWAKQLVAGLKDPRERRIIEMRFGFGEFSPMSREEIGCSFSINVSRGRVVDLEGRALGRIALAIQSQVFIAGDRQASQAQAIIERVGAIKASIIEPQHARDQRIAENKVVANWNPR